MTGTIDLAAALQQAVEQARRDRAEHRPLTKAERDALDLDTWAEDRVRENRGEYPTPGDDDYYACVEESRETRWRMGEA